MATNAGWIINLGPGAYWAETGFPSDAMTQISAMINAKDSFRHIRFAPNGSWVIIGDGNYHWYSNGFPSDLREAMEVGISGGNLALSDVFIAPTGDWVIKWKANSNGARTYSFSTNLPSSIQQQINTIDARGTTNELLSLVFPPAGGWLGIWQNNVYHAQSIPQDCFSKLGDLVRGNLTLQSIAFSSSDGWIIVCANNAYFANGAFDQSIYQKVGELINQNYTIAEVVLGIPQPAFTFTLNSIMVKNTRSAGNDTDYVGLTVVVNNQLPATVPQAFKSLGDVNGPNRSYPVNLTVGPVSLSDPNEPVVIVYHVINSSKGQSESHQILSEAAQKAAQAAGSALSALAKTATVDALTTGALAGVGAAIGAAIGTAALPIIGSIIGAGVGALVSAAENILFTNCDGTVAIDTFALTAPSLAILTLDGQTFTKTLEYNKTLFPDQADGTPSPYDNPGGICRSSDYTVTFSVQRA